MGEKAPEEIPEFNLSITDTSGDCDEYSFMDYEVDTYPNIKIVVHKMKDNEWYIRDGFVGILEDDLTITHKEELAAFTLQEMGVEEDLVKVRYEVGVYEEEEGVFVPRFDGSEGIDIILKEQV